MNTYLKFAIYIALSVGVLSFANGCSKDSRSRDMSDTDVDSDTDSDSDTGTDSDEIPKPNGDSTLEWIEIPGGSYIMGSGKENTDEIPLHEVTIETFEILKSEVTVAQFWECYADDHSCAAGSTSGDCSFGAEDRGNFPVTCVDWHQAKAFCEWAGGRLPTEAEWEYAARNGGQEVIYPWGDDEPTCEHAVIENEEGFACGTYYAWEVCSKKAGDTSHGLCDMIGNVWEWVEDDRHQDYEDAPTDGSAWVNDPRATRRMIRGGCFGSSIVKLRATYRHDRSPEYFGVASGMRCVR
ncbi:MAG: formylglycine-generating enzyme family protein [Proteobacteria bacterium]|nr:formylglycine-generating enzyme family protein [Pseudomonadota bacterium]